MAKRANIKASDIKVAKNPGHALWIRACENLEQEIKELENSLIVSKAFLEKANEMAAYAKAGLS